MSGKKRWKRRPPVPVVVTDPQGRRVDYVWDPACESLTVIIPMAMSAFGQTISSTMKVEVGWPTPQFERVKIERNEEAMLADRLAEALHDVMHGAEDIRPALDALAAHDARRTALSREDIR